MKYLEKEYLTKLDLLVQKYLEKRLKKRSLQLHADLSVYFRNGHNRWILYPEGSIYSSGLSLSPPPPPPKTTKKASDKMTKMLSQQPTKKTATPKRMNQQDIYNRVLQITTGGKTAP